MKMPVVSHNSVIVLEYHLGSLTLVLPLLQEKLNESNVLKQHYQIRSQSPKPLLVILTPAEHSSVVRRVRNKVLLKMFLLKIVGMLL